MQTSAIWQRLRAELDTLATTFAGVTGIAVQHLPSGAMCSVHGDELFPTASTIKIPVLVQLLARAERGEVDLQQPVHIDPADHVQGSGVLAALEGDVSLSLYNLAVLMIVLSDNTATNLCIDVAGLDATNELLDQLGLRTTRLRRKMMDHLAAVREQENISTPLDLVALLTMLYAGRPTPFVAEGALKVLLKPKHGFLNRALPEDTTIANKPGYVPGARCDAGIVYLPRDPYAVAVMTKFAWDDADEHERYLLQALRRIHRIMAAIDRSNQYGRYVD